MNNEQNEKILFRDYILERQIFESIGLTEEEYIIKKFEIATGKKFDPAIHEIVRENNAYDDGYDNPISTFYIVEKKKEKTPIPPIPPVPPRPPHIPGEGNGPHKPEGQNPPHIPGEGNGPHKPNGGNGPHTPGEGHGPHVPEGEKPPHKPGEQNPPHGPEGQQPPHKPGEHNPPHVPEGQQPPHKPGEQNPPRGPEGEQPPHKPGEQNPPRGPEGEKPPHKPGEHNPPHVPEGQQPPHKPGEQNPPHGPEGEQPPHKPEDEKKRPRPIVKRDPIAEEDEKKHLVQDMLDKYYGNPEKRKEYILRYKRFKSHIVDKEFEYVDKDGHKVKGTCKTIDTTYPEYKEDAQFLQLQEYAFKIERLSRAELGDYSLYEIVANEYIQTLELRGERFEGSRKELIEAMRAEDAEYIATNNYAYNTHRATRENLSTLGKHGERVPFIPMSQEKTAKAKLGNVARFLANAGILVRRYTTAPISRALGRFVVKPLHELLFDADQQPAGMYRGKRTHRYEARKVYYESLYLEELEEENERRKQQGQPLKKINGLVLAFRPRLQAIFQYQEGNKAVLNAGAYDIDESYERIQEERIKTEKQIAIVEDLLDEAITKINELKQEMEKKEKSGNYPPEEKVKDEDEMRHLLSRVIEGEKMLYVLEHGGQDIIQTDAISLAVHDMANKENMTKVVTGVRTAIRIAAMSYIGPRIKKIITERLEKDVYVPETRREPDQTIIEPAHWTTQTVQETKRTIKPVKISDMLEIGEDGTISVKSMSPTGDVIPITRSAKGGRVGSVGEKYYIRGIHYKKRSLSSADCNGFDLFGKNNLGQEIARADVELAVNPDDDVLDLFVQIWNLEGRRSPITREQLIEEFLSAEDPQKAVQDFLNGIQLWVSKRKTGVPSGWTPSLGSLVSLNLENLTEDVVVEKIVEVFVEEQLVTIPGKEVTELVLRKAVTESLREVIDWRYGSIEGALLAGQMIDLNDILRRTREKVEVVGEVQHDFPEKGQERPRQTVVPPHQRNNKAKHGKRHYKYGRYNFDGTRRGDYASTYDESGKGTPGDYVDSETHTKGR